MKISSNWTLALKLVLVSSTLSFAGEYRDRVIVISKIFRNSDPDVQYVARRDLEVLVSDATAPTRANGASKITDDLLYALVQNDIPVEAKKYILRQLARVGTSKAVSPLAQIVMGRDKHLAEEARAAIESIRGSKASNALKAAYGKMNTEGKLNILKSSIAGFQHYILERNRVRIELVSAAHSHFALLSHKPDHMAIALISAYYFRSISVYVILILLALVSLGDKLHRSRFIPA